MIDLIVGIVIGILIGYTVKKQKIQNDEKFKIITNLDLNRSPCIELRNRILSLKPNASFQCVSNYENLKSVLKRYKFDAYILRFHMQSDCPVKDEYPWGKLTDDLWSTIPSNKLIIIGDHDSRQARFQKQVEERNLPYFEWDDERLPIKIAELK